MSEYKNEPKKYSNILFLQGGAGDVLCATTAVHAFRKAFPQDELIVAATYAILLENNPDIDILVHLNKESEVQDFYETYVLGKNVRFYKKFFPYDHILDTPSIGCKNLSEFMVSLYGVKDFYDGDPSPKYYPTEYEKKAANRFITQDKKPVVLLHIYGAVPSENGIGKMVCGACAGKGLGPDGTRCQVCGGGGVLIIRDKTNCLKDLNPIVVSELIAKYQKDYNFLQIGLEGEPVVQGAFDCLGMPFRDTCALIQHEQVKSFIFIESSFAHVAAAFKKKGVVVFQNTSPFFFGYPSAVNFFDPCAKECKLWPCNRPVGALMDFAPGYANPKTRQRTLWNCTDQLCAKIQVGNLEKAFLDSLVEEKKEETEEPKIGGQSDTLEGAYSL